MHVHDMFPMKNYNLLVFDWDGTLINSGGLFIESIKKTALDLGCLEPESAAITKCFGLGVELTRQQLCPAANQAIFHEVFHKYFNGEQHSTFFTGAIETLTDLRDQGFVLAIATNKPRAKLDSALHNAKIKDLFAATRCPDNSFPKPHPEMLITLLDELMYQPEDALMIGDTIFDMQFAQNAKVDALAACYGSHDKEQMAAFNPIGFIEDIRDLKKILN
jgi:phosphoglycolate phosphatase